MLGFAGSSMLPSQVHNCLGQVIEHIWVDKTAGIWETIIQAISHNLLFLKVNTVVVIFREQGLKNVFCRKVGKHSPPMRPWDMQFRVCGTPHCIRRPLDFFVQNDYYNVCMMQILQLEVGMDEGAGLKDQCVQAGQDSS
jgi:hypothetical protein